MNTVFIDGHSVPADRVDEFFNGRDGARVTDEQWDTSRDRTAETLEELQAFGFDYVGTTCPEGHELAEAVSDNGNLVTTDN